MIPAVEIGLRHLEKIGVETINERVRCLTGWLLDQLGRLHHTGGRPLLRLHGPTDLDQRGGTITISFFDPDGVPISGALVERMASAEKISLRTGCFCNPGAGEMTFQLSPQLMSTFFKEAKGIHFAELVQKIYDTSGVDVSAVRISVGLATNFSDIYRFLRFAAGFQDRTAASLGQTAEDMACGSLARDTP